MEGPTRTIQEIVAADSRKTMAVTFAISAITERRRKILKRNPGARFDVIMNLSDGHIEFTAFGEDGTTKLTHEVFKIK